MKKIYILSILLLIFVIMLSNFYRVYGDNFYIQDYKNPNTDEGGIASYAKSVTNEGVGVASAIAGGCVAIAILLISIKYITSAPDGKADVKRYAIPFVIGCAIVFGASGILMSLFNIAQSIG